jgi:hypothetical protein
MKANLIIIRVRSTDGVELNYRIQRTMELAKLKVSGVGRDCRHR